MPSVRVERTETGFTATNDRGGRIEIGSTRDEGVFSPVELLLAALGGCEMATVEPLTAKRGHRLAKLATVVEAEKVSDTELRSFTVTYEIELPPEDEKALEVFRSVAGRVHERYCPVGKALKNPMPVEQRLP
ncbi:putative OsmC-like protein [Actinocorallia herbida]|uniref:Putative OsmC-like protein n=1 Tax=Actinocorallia herbida TaxID=58109 RepID=A0A3N1CR53_9ACTN|nr:OsmC family protein [Actinocorallia herbida]ROO83792.1 putative OsmC-like protein [Actinocorallia herbida]